jgi:hypothetical protein
MKVEYLAEMLGKLESGLLTKLDGIDVRMGAMETRLDAKIDGMESRMDQGFNDMNQRIGRVEGGIAQLTERGVESDRYYKLYAITYRVSIKYKLTN